MRTLIYGLLAVAVSLGLVEVVMQPSAGERVEIGLIFASMAVLMALVARWLPSRARRNRSLRSTVAMLSLLAFSIVAVGTIAAANRMFISDHDLTFLLIVLVFGILASVGFAVTVAGALTSDLNDLSRVAQNIAAGEHGQVRDLGRRDEVGRLAAALEKMSRKLQEAELERARDSETRRAFFAAVGHDLRTPLASLRAALEAVQDGVVLDTERYLESMERDVMALGSLVDDVFLLARLDSGSFEIEPMRVDITEVVDEAIDVLNPMAAERDVTLTLDAAGSLFANATPEAVGRVIRNLLDNAIRHAPEGSSISVDVSNGSDTVKVRVVDEGDGFSHEFLPVAFQRFSREDDARTRDSGGSGLGLAIAGELVEALEGRIWAEPGPGGRVSFELPVAG